MKIIGKYMNEAFVILATIIALSCNFFLDFSDNRNSSIWISFVYIIIFMTCLLLSINWFFRKWSRWWSLLVGYLSAIPLNFALALCLIFILDKVHFQSPGNTASRGWGITVGTLILLLPLWIIVILTWSRLSKKNSASV